MTIPPAELYELIRRFEGCRLKAYLCPAGVWTCGFGSTGPDIGPHTVWTMEYALARLKVDAERFALGTLKLCPGLWLEEPKVLAAVADFAYNLGLTRLKGSTLRKRINERNWSAARKEIARWVWAGGRRLRGLTLRRAAEAQLLPKGT